MTIHLTGGAGGRTTSVHRAAHRAAEPTARRSRFGSDRQLTVRMVSVLFLLGLLYVAFVAALIVLLKSACAGGARRRGTALRPVLVLRPDRPVRDARPRGDPRGAAGAARRRRPAVRPGRHAQAPGRGRRHRRCRTPSPPAATRTTPCSASPPACSRRLDQEELEGVLAHELSHVAHRDVTVITIASFLGVLAGLLVRFALYSGCWRPRPPGQPEDRAGDRRGDGRLGRRLHDQLRADPGPVPLPGAGRRPLGGPAHRPPLGPGLGADQGQRGDRPDPGQDLRTAQTFNAFFFAPALSKGRSLPTSSHPPDAGAAAGGTGQGLRAAGRAGVVRRGSGLLFGASCRRCLRSGQ